ncbi:MAG: protein-L-isoaspartate O-methyltransferase, partial [Gammaproteobacteria bacterium]
HGDGFLGWAENAPYDAILVAAAPVGVPVQLLEQLAIGGRMVIPVGRAGSQELRLLTRTASGVDEAILERVSFVPLLDGIS